MKTFQYNEEEILQEIFPERFADIDLNGARIKGTSIGGFLVEIGAADGIDNSNSYDLIKHHGWSGLLVEPHPGYYMDLLHLYAQNPNVTLSHYAITKALGRKQLGIDGQCSSLIYPKSVSVEVQCVTLTTLFELYRVPEQFNFLSIDCEGEDMNVLRSLDWDRYSIDVVCVEHSMPKEELDSFMASKDYKLFDRNLGNSFYT